MTPRIKIDSRAFQVALQKYMAVSKRSLAEVINQKSYSIALAATSLTHRAAKAKIRADLTSAAKGANAPLAAVIINSYLKKGGAKGDRWAKNIGKPVGKGLYGKEMAEAVKVFISKSQAAASYVRSGWLPSVALFAKAIGKTPGRNAAKWAKKTDIGGGEKAKPGLNPTSKFWNQAGAKDEFTTKKEAPKHALSGLKLAIDQEVRRMGEYLTRKLQKDANQIVNRFLR